MYFASDPMLQCQPRPLVMERRWKSNVELAPNCPRCASSNTKFCYYNNYSLSQPRYFCKGCRRYWTKGGTLRNVPVGGGCRKSRRTKAVRTPSGDRLSVFTNDGGGSPSPALTTSEPSNSLVPPGGPNGQDIDLAAVFAKFLNQSTPESHDEANQLSEKSGSSNQDVLLEDIFIKCQTQSNSTEEGENFLSGLTEVFSCGDHQTQQIEQPAQGFPGHDPNTFGLQSMLSDDLPQDLLWSDATNNFPNFAWQPITQLHEFGSNPCDDPSKISANIGDNWSLFDMPAYEIFSRP